MGHEERSLMPDTDPTPARRRRLLLDVTQAASEVSRLVHEARDLHLPVEPGVRDGRDALVRLAVLIEEVLPYPDETLRGHQQVSATTLNFYLAASGADQRAVRREVLVGISPELSAQLRAELPPTEYRSERLE
jgi:hypothetical protein